MGKARTEEILDLTGGNYRRQYSGFIRGKRISSISLEAEAWFWRVHAIVDDFGNHEADPQLVCDATRGRRCEVTVDRVAAWLCEMEAQKLLSFYESDSDKYLHISGFVRMQPAPRNGRRVRRFPPSPQEESDIRGNPGESGGYQDHNHDQDQEDCGEAADATSPPAYPIFPCVRGTKRGALRWELADSFIKDLQASFPGVNVPAQCREAWTWVMCNTDRRKTSRGMPDFLRRWMAKEQDKRDRYGFVPSATAPKRADPVADNFAKIPPEDFPRLREEFLKAYPKLHAATRNALELSPGSVREFREWAVKARSNGHG